MGYQYKPKGVCSRSISFDLEDGLIKNVKFEGGCNGNAQGISRLVEGMPAQEAVKRLSGIHCSMKTTSCPDQLATAITKALANSCGGNFSFGQ